MQGVATAVRELGDLHFRVLRAIELMSRRMGVVPLDTLAESTGLSGEYTGELLRALHRLGLVWSPMGRRAGYALSRRGLDALALRALSRRGIVTHVGRRIGAGEEAEIYETITGEGERAALKFYRLARPVAKKYRRYRAPEADPLAASKMAARREIEALTILSRRRLDVPTPIYRNRHVVVTSLIEGRELARVRSLRDPARVLGRIIENIDGALEAGVVHCDLSPYRILVREDESILIVDWHRWVAPRHVMARAYLERGIENIVGFFKRRLHLPVTQRELYGSIRWERLG